MELPDLGRVLLVLGGVIFVLGLLLTFGGSLPFLGRLPGDISFERDNVKVYIPIASMILVSVLLTVVLNLISGLFRR